MTGNEYRIWKVAMMRLMGAAARTVAARHGVDGEQYYILMWTMVSFSRKNGNLLTRILWTLWTAMVGKLGIGDGMMRTCGG
jgi:hypothetical protein